ncbi:MAG: AraC family transcriptional regulator [Pseudomonadota bacterium]
MGQGLALEHIDVGLRLLTLGQMLVTVLALWLRRIDARSFVALTGLVLGGAGYLIASNHTLSVAVGPFGPLVDLFATAFPYLLWWFAVAAFELHAAWRWIAIPACVTAVQMVALLAGEPSWGAPALGVAARIAALGVVGMLLHALVMSRSDDLVPARRRYRQALVLSVGAMVAITVVVELLTLDAAGAPYLAKLTLLSAAAILVLNLALMIPLLSYSEILPPRSSPTTRPPAATDSRTSPGIAAPALAKLEGLMRNRLYARHGLTVADVAAELDVAERELRHLINGELGFRNFSAYVNGWRLDEISRRLITEPKLPVLTIALEAGFASIGPCNRAFRRRFGCTPTEFRERPNFETN